MGMNLVYDLMHSNIIHKNVSEKRKNESKKYSPEQGLEPWTVRLKA